MENQIVATREIDPLALFLLEPSEEDAAFERWLKDQDSQISAMSSEGNSNSMGSALAGVLTVLRSVAPWEGN